MRPKSWLSRSDAENAAPRIFYTEGKRISTFFVWAILGIGALLITAMMVLLNRTVLIPLKKWILCRSPNYTDTTGESPHTLNLKDDYVVNFTFDPSANQTLVNLYKDVDGNGTGDTYKGTVTPDNVKSIWEAGRLLWERDLTADPRTVYTTTDGSTLRTFDSSTTTATELQSYLQAPTVTAAQKIINFIKGIDYPGDATMRNRTVTIGTASNVWKLGDIISSTPRIESKLPLNNYQMAPPSGYNDKTYISFTSSNQYQSHSMAYAGANDGLFHAFNLGSLDVTGSGFQKATLSGSNIGREQWAFVPRNALPYLTYLTDPNYNHLYYLDVSSTIADVAIGVPANCTGSYWECTKNASDVDTANDLDLNLTGWRTVLIGGMGLGGSSRKGSDTCTNCVKTPRNDPANNSNGLGYSSYFALDVTTPTTPSLLWEFSNPNLGYTTTGPAIIRIGQANKNGRWFALFASGPTGPIDTTNHQFLGKSEQNLRLFVVDLKDGSLVQTIDTGIENAFAGSLQGGALDADRWNPSSTSNYQDDMVYVGYVSRTGAGTTASPYSWTNGGVLRMAIKSAINPSSIQAEDFITSKVIDGIGPVTMAISRLQDRNNKRLWLYFGTGRYYYKSSTEGAFDDCSGQRALYGVKDPCYTNNTIDFSCATTVDASALANQSTSSNSVDKGWFINLDGSAGGVCAERVITNPVALTNGAVFFTTFKPTIAPACDHQVARNSACSGGIVSVR